MRRACYAADRTGHMILQTLYQQCVKRDVRFFNEFYCLDLLRADDGSDRRRRGLRARDRRAPRLPREVGRVRDRRLRSDVPRHLERARADRRRPGRRLAARHPARGHGDVPVPSHGPRAPRACCCRRPRAARAASCSTRTASASWTRYAPTIKDLAPRDMVSRAIYQEIKEGRGGGPNGDWAYLDISHLDPQDDRGEAARHHRVRPRLPEGGADEGAGADPADRPLRDGRHPDRHRRPGRDRPGRGGRARGSTPPASAPA